MKLRQDLILREMGSEHVIVDPSQDVVDMSKVFTLNETAAKVWRELKDLSFTNETIAMILIKHYDVNPDLALKDADALVESFQKEGLLEG